MASTVVQPKKCTGRRFERGGPFMAKGFLVLGRKAGHGLPPCCVARHIHGRKGEKVWGKQMAKKKRQPNLTQAQIVGLAECPECNAGVGQQCTEAGRTRSRNHVMRVEAALAQLGVMVRLTKKRREGDPVRAKPKPIAKEFYETWEWKEARFAALKRHGRECQCCGWTPGSGGANYLVVDHIKPIRTHPQLALDPNNHQVLCNDCNMGKSYKHTDDFRV